LGSDESVEDGNFVGGRTGVSWFSGSAWVSGISLVTLYSFGFDGIDESHDAGLVQEIRNRRPRLVSVSDLELAGVLLVTGFPVSENRVVT
jgi:hypothetical protein